MVPVHFNLYGCIARLILPVSEGTTLLFKTDDFQDGNNSDCHEDCWSVKDWSARKGTRSSLSMVSYCLQTFSSPTQIMRDIIKLVLYFLYMNLKAFLP